MARPRTIKWDKRVEIFLRYRLLGNKVYPVAKNHNVARSTVTLIVKEFEAMGFSDRPRPKVSTETLQLLQEHHLTGLISLLKEPSVETSPGDLAMGTLDITPAIREEAALEALTKNPLYVHEELEWHLRGNKVEQVFGEARDAAADYHERDHAAWRDLRAQLETLCGSPVREPRSESDNEPHILPYLVSLLRNAFFSLEFRSRPPSPNWITWDTDPAARSSLRASGQSVAVGTAEDHNKVHEGTEKFLQDHFRSFQYRFTQVERLRFDLGVMPEVVETALKGVRGEDIRKGICPACVYPEALVEA